MNISCPHCSQVIELTPEVHASLRGQPHLACPTCQGLMAVPPMPASAPKQAPRWATDVHKAAMQAQRSLNRNMLVLGVVALLALGGLATFLASRNGGSVFNIFQNTTNQIIRNSYFTQLIASGETTEKDLKMLAEIRPFGDGYIGISKEALTWPQAQELAARTTSSVLDFESGDKVRRRELVDWLTTTYPNHLSPPVWVEENGQPLILDGQTTKEGTGLDQPKKVLLKWFDPGPLVFEDTLAQADSLEKCWSFDGQYGGKVSVVPGVGMKTQNGHTWPMAWIPAVLGDRCRIEFEIDIGDGGHAAWVVKGSGTGNSLDTGYGMDIHRTRARVRREGEEWMVKTMAGPLTEGRWHKVQIDLSGTNLSLRVNGTLIAKGAAIEALSGPLHGWFGISGYGTTYRNLRIFSSEANQKQERQLIPSATIPPRPNGEQIYSFSEPDGPLGQRWSVAEPDRAKVNDGVLILDGSPFAVLDVPLPSSVAVELDHEFDYPQALNLVVKFIHASVFPRRFSECTAMWSVGYPQGNGSCVMDWVSNKKQKLDEFGETHFSAGGGNRLASTPYFVPIQYQKHTLRFEVVADTLRIFIGGRLHLRGTRPSDAAIQAPLFLGLGQAYSRSKIHAIRIYKLNAP